MSTLSKGMFLPPSYSLPSSCHPPTSSSLADAPSPSESWLARQQSKKNQRTRVCCLFWLFFFILLAGAIIAVIVCLDQGYFDDLGKALGTEASEAEASASASATASGSASGPSATVMR